VDAAVEISGAEASWILFPYHIHHTLILETGRFPGEIRCQGFSTPMSTSLEGWVFSNQQPVIINNIGTYDHGIGDLISLPGLEIKSSLVVPISIKDNHIGILEAVNKQSGEFTPLDLEMLVTFANQIAIYIDNTHRFLQTDLVTELVHELHTPLAALNTALFLLQRPDLQDERRAQISQMIHHEFTRLTELTTSFLDYARMESGRARIKPALFDINQLIIESTEIIRMQLEGKGLVISFDLPAEPVFITADKDKIKQVILNLLSNAVKYTNSRGNIKVTLSSSVRDVSFSIQDDGQGIPPEFLPHLFERFYRVPNTERGVKGTGLGLTISKQIVEAHNGVIEVSSEMGHGTIFTVRVPISQ
jgi:signal transduction histidine kinase